MALQGINSQDPEFYAFYRSMQAYEAALQPKNKLIGFAAGLPVLPLFRRPVGCAALEIAPKWPHLDSSRSNRRSRGHGEEFASPSI